MADLNRLESIGKENLNKTDDATNIDPARLEKIEEKIVTATLETILLNANWLFLTSKGDSVNRVMLNQDDQQEIVE